MGKARDWDDVGAEGGPGAIRREGDDPATDIPFDAAPPAQTNGEAHFAEELPGHSKAPLTYDEMLAMPEPDFLVFGVVPRRGKTCLFGVSNSFNGCLEAKEEDCGECSTNSMRQVGFLGFHCATDNV
jgi:hypothetical protein